MMKQKRLRNLCICLLTTMAMCLAACGNTAGQTPAGNASTETSAVTAAAQSGDGGATTEVVATATQASESAEEEIDIIPAESEYAYSLIVSINPECELYFDAHDVVVGFAYLNEDAKTAYYQPEYTWIGLSLEDSMTQLITAADKAGFIKEEPAVKILTPHTISGILKANICHKSFATQATAFLRILRKVSFFRTAAM